MNVDDYCIENIEL